MTTDLNGITEETLAAVRKAQTAGLTAGTGIAGVDLSGVVSLVPVNTPFYDRVKRTTTPQGANAAQWKTLLNVNAAQPNPFVGFDGGGNFIQFAEQDVLAKFQPVRVSGRVTYDEVDLSRGYADARALAVTGTLMQWRLAENKALLGGQNFPLPAIGAPVVTNSNTGGSIASASSPSVKVAARSGFNYYYGGSGVASAATAGAATSGSTSSVSASVAAVRGAVAYDWFVNGFYLTTTAQNVVTFTSIPTSNNTSVPNLPGLSVALPAAVPTLDTSFSTFAYNGLIATLTGDYGFNGQTTAGTAQSSGATVTSLNGGTLTGAGQSIVEIDNLLMSIYNSAQMSPTALVMNGALAATIGNRVLGSNAAFTYLDPKGTDRVGTTAGGSVARYVNKAAGGTILDIVVDPAFFPGMIAAVADVIPYPNSNIANTFEARCLRDVAERPYGTGLVTGPGVGGPRDEWDVSSVETFVNRAPAACALLTDITAN